MSQKLDLSYPYGKFWRGIVRWSRDGEIDLKSEKGISQVNALLKVICHSPSFDCYDSNFNGLSLDAVVNSLNINLDAEEYHSDCPHNYRIEQITSFEQALKRICLRRTCRLWKEPHLFLRQGRYGEDSGFPGERVSA